MTKGDKIKLRAELAGKAMQGLLSGSDTMASLGRDSKGRASSAVRYLTFASVEYADALMAGLGISMDKED